MNIYNGFFKFNFPFICYVEPQVTKLCYEPQVSNTHLLSKKENLSVMLWCSVYLYYTALPYEDRTQVLCIADLYKDLKHLFRLLENETLKIFSIRGRRKSRHKFGGTKVCKAKEVMKYFENRKIEIDVFSYIICSLNFKKYLMCSLLHMKMMNGVVSWHVMALHDLFHFIACVSFRFFLFFLIFFVIFITC